MSCPVFWDIAEAWIQRALRSSLPCADVHSGRMEDLSSFHGSISRILWSQFGLPADDGFSLPGLDTPTPLTDAPSAEAKPAEAALSATAGNAPPLLPLNFGQPPSAQPSTITDPFAMATAGKSVPPSARASVPKAKEKDDFYSSDSDESSATDVTAKPRRQFKVGLLACWHVPVAVR